MGGRVLCALRELRGGHYHGSSGRLYVLESGSLKHSWLCPLSAQRVFLCQPNVLLVCGVISLLACMRPGFSCPLSVLFVTVYHISPPQRCNASMTTLRICSGTSPSGNTPRSTSSAMAATAR